MAEAGYPEIESDSWVGVLAPVGTPKDIIALLHRAIVQILAQPEMQARLATLGYDVVASTPDQFMARIKLEIAMWAKVIRAANLKAE
jgi:tripartite-type tricarboxylate transporter receptor subunit TctC